MKNWVAFNDHLLIHQGVAYVYSLKFPLMSVNKSAYFFYIYHKHLIISKILWDNYYNDISDFFFKEDISLT